MNLQKKIDDVERRVIAACQRSGRIRDEIHIVAVTKYTSLEMTEAVLQSGCLHIGESRWQDAKPKWDALGSLGRWHFIGHLQTNKVKDIINKFQYIHSLDRLSLAKELDRKAREKNIQVKCFIQVNVSGESSKFGLAPAELISFAEKLVSFSHLEVLGLMTMAPYEAPDQQIRQIFSDLRRLKDDLNEKSIFNYKIPHLSMGMSNDFEIAIEEGATWIRLGSVIVGENEE